jgi:replication factor A1
MQNYELLVEKIANSANLEKQEVERRIEAKKAKLSGLISKEGAAQIVAAELGINFENELFKISELVPGMKRVNVIGKIIDLYPVRQYERKGKKEKVANFILADSTSNIRTVLWDTNHIALIESNEIKKDDVVEVKNASVREQEIHLGSFSDIKKSDKVLENVKTERVVQEKSIEELSKGQNIKIRGVIVQIFNPRFFNVCPDCGKKAVQDAEGFKCEEHGKVSPKERALINFVLDDGTETIRSVLFSEQISKLIPEEDLKNPEKLLAFRDKYLGKEIYTYGIVRQNQLFNNLEIIVNGVEEVDPEKLIEVLEKS